MPVQFRVESGNATDDRSHRATWDLLCKLTGRRDFLYVADCKLATAENMAHIHQHGGRFLSVLPRTRGEDAAFRDAVREGQARWRPIHDKLDDEGELVDRFSVHEPEATSAEGYRLIWYHSTRKAELDALARHQRVERASARAGRAAAEAGLAADAVPRAGQGRRGGRGDPPRRRRRGLDRGHDRGTDDRDVPPGAARPPGGRDAVRASGRTRGST